MWKRNKGKRNVLVYLFLFLILTIMIILLANRNRNAPVFIEIMAPEEPDITARRIAVPQSLDRKPDPAETITGNEEPEPPDRKPVQSLMLNTSSEIPDAFGDTNKINGNAFRILQEAVKLLPPALTPDPEFSNGRDYEPLKGSLDEILRIRRRDDDPELIEYLTNGTQPSIDKIREALNYTYYLYPEIGDMQTNGSHLAPSRHIARIMSARARKILRDGGDINEAYQYVWDTIRLGQMVGSDGAIIDYLVGIAIQSIGIVRLDEIVQYDESDNRLQQAAFNIRILETQRNDIRRNIEFEFRAIQNQLKNNDWNVIVEHIPYEEFKRDTLYYFLKSLPITKSIPDYYDRSARERAKNKAKSDVIRALELIRDNKEIILQGASLPFLEYEEWSEEHSFIIQQIEENDYFPISPSISVAAARTHASYRGCAIIIAQERYYRANGIYPEKLEELQPEFIKALPRDPFSGYNFIYKKVDEDYLLYSVYINQKDNGGNTRKKDDYLIHPTWE